MPLYYLLIGRRLESVLGVHEHRRGFDRLISGCVCPCVTTMLYPTLFTGKVLIVKIKKTYNFLPAITLRPKLLGCVFNCLHTNMVNFGPCLLFNHDQNYPDNKSGLRTKSKIEDPDDRPGLKIREYRSGITDYGSG